MPVTAVVVSAGASRRMGSKTNKTLLSAGGKPVIIRALKAFENCTSVDDIILVVRKKETGKFRRILNKYGLKKMRDIVGGGKRRRDSVFNGLKRCGSRTEIVLIHDGARPFISREIIEESILSARKYGSGITAVPVIDTVKEADGNMIVKRTLPRKTLWAMQTPQTFKYKAIMDAYKKIENTNRDFTDDAEVLEDSGKKVKLIMGDYGNIKITTQFDLKLANFLAGTHSRM